MITKQIGEPAKSHSVFHCLHVGSPEAHNREHPCGLMVYSNHLRLKSQVKPESFIQRVPDSQPSTEENKARKILPNDIHYPCTYLF